MSSSSRLEAGVYLEALKELLRERAVTYAELADRLGCSLPTVKRALNKPSLPFSRLLQFCEIAGLPFEDVHRAAKRRRPKHYVFDNRQDRLFAEREELLAYLFELAEGETTPLDIAQRHDLDALSTELYLTHLESLDLIVRGAGDEVTLRVRPPFGFGPGSQVLRQKHERFLSEIVANVVKADPAKERSFAVLKPLDLNDEDYDQLVIELVAVVDRFAAIGERGLGRSNRSRWQVAIAAGPSDEPSSKHLPRIKE